MTADPAVATWEATLDNHDRADDLFHIAADHAEDLRAEGGLPWRTLCGQRRPPARDTHDPEVIMPDDCVVCVELHEVEIWGDSE